MSQVIKDWLFNHVHVGDRKESATLAIDQAKPGTSDVAMVVDEEKMST